MSRIVVKNLPKNVTEETLRKIFGERGTVTDVQLKHTADGKFRHFAFVGYQNENEAEDAVKYLNNICIKFSKITVEPCVALGDTKKPKAWSKYAPDSIAYKKAHKEDISAEPPKEKKEKKKKKKKDATEELLAKYKNDPMFEEFLQVHAPEETKKLRQLDVANDDEEDEVEPAEKSDRENSDDKEDEQEETEEKLANKEISDADYMKKLMEKKENKPKKEPKNIKLHHLKIKGLPYNCKKKEIKQFFKPLTPFSIRVPRQIHGIAFVGFKGESDMKKALMKDRSFISGKRVSVIKYVSGEEANGETEDNPIKAKWKKQEDSLKNEEEIAESGKIFFRNLTYTTTETDIENLFAKFGPVTEVSLPVDKTSGIIKGFGTVTFMMPENAVRAYSELDGTVLHGRMLHLLPGKNNDATDDQDLEESSNFKKKKSAQQKAQAGSSFNWNSLFLGHDAVARIISEKHDMSKKDILLEKDNAAVLLALGESGIVTETKKYLEKEGVVLNSFNTPTTKKSKTVLLVKNLPERTEVSVIRNMFQKYGMVGRVILPPSGITAIVEFFQPSEAKKAYAGLAYSKFKHTPLYLEWAPEDSLLERQASANNEVEEKTDKPIENTAEGNDKLEEEEEDEEPEEDTTLFVKNLNFQTTDVELTKHFEPCGRLVYASVATKKDKNNPQNKLSMGYGFVRYYEKKCADRALTDLQQSILDGKSLELKRSQRVSEKTEVQDTRKITKKTKQTGTKILVRNVPFQAKSTDILQLFKTFGEIKAVRLPKKKRMDVDSHRGFAFVDFVLPSDAKKAFENLSLSTHLYGRRLVLEWASQEDDVDQIRKRTADHFHEPEQQKSKKSVFSID